MKQVQRSRHSHRTASTNLLPARYATMAASLPERLSYRVKDARARASPCHRPTGRPATRKPTALAVLSSDVMSSSAYATEEILRVLVPIGGLVAFSLVTPITGAIVAVLAVVTICYRDVVRSYPKAGRLVRGEPR